MFNQFDLYVYNRNLDFLGIIDFSTFSSIRWRRKYYEADEFEIHTILKKEEISKFLVKDNIIIREDTGYAGIIDSYKITDTGEDEKIVIIGRSIVSILDRRIVKNKINFSGKILDGERTILNQISPFSKLEIEQTTIDSESIVFQCTYKNVYKYLNKLAKTSTIAHRIIPDLQNKKYIYQNYQGLDRTESQRINPRYEFSEDRENIDNADYTFTSKDEKNYALVGGQGEGSSRVIVEIKKGDYEDFDLKEVFVDAKSESNEGLTDAQYKEVLKTKGNENINDPIESMEVTAYAKDYKNGWDLGDIVNIKKESWNITMKRRITEVEETIESGNQKIFVTFGDPLSEMFQDDDDED